MEEWYGLLHPAAKKQSKQTTIPIFIAKAPLIFLEGLAIASQHLKHNRG
jgi:hypothetical protein